MILQIDDWKFDIDMECTMEYSANEAAEHCDCAYCRNFYAAVDGKYPELRPFLAQFGLDIEAPEEMFPNVYSERMIDYNPAYIVYGKILNLGSYEMSSGLANIVARMCDGIHEYFELDLYEITLPWILDEPIEDVVSPANEPSFMQKMVEKLLGRAKKSDLES